jgi:hypothetical protein
MLRGQGGVVARWKNKLEAAAAHIMSSESLAERHRENGGAGHSL